MARGYNAEVTNVKVLEEGVCHVVQGRSAGQRAVKARRVVAASVMLLAAIVACVALAGSAPGSKQQMAESRLYSATGWDSIYGGGKSANSDTWGDVSGADDTGARHTGLHEDDGDDDDSDVDPDSAKGDHHWNAADDSTSKTATSSNDDDDDDDKSGATSSQKQAKSSKGPSSKGAKAVQESKAKTKADKLLRDSAAFDKKLPTPKSRAEEKKQKAAQLAHLLRIQKELASDYKKVLAKGDSIRNKGKKLGLMKDKATSTAELQVGDPFSA